MFVELMTFRAFGLARVSTRSGRPKDAHSDRLSLLFH
jgi:hypothetical protein